MRRKISAPSDWWLLIRSKRFSFRFLPFFLNRSFFASSFSLSFAAAPLLRIKHDSRVKEGELGRAIFSCIVLRTSALRFAPLRAVPFPYQRVISLCVCISFAAASLCQTCVRFLLKIVLRSYIALAITVKAKVGPL